MKFVAIEAGSNPAFAKSAVETHAFEIDLFPKLSDGMSKYLNNTIRASDPLRITLSTVKLRMLEPQMFGWKGLWFRFPLGNKQLNAKQTKEMLSQHLANGDSRAALVVRATPLLVAAYTDEIDCVVLLQFPDWLVEDYQLKAGSRLITTNTYWRGKAIARDLVEGPAALKNWASFYPIIADFLSGDADILDRRKQLIAVAEWKRTWAMAQSLLRQPHPAIRDGRPLESWRQALAQ